MLWIAVGLTYGLSTKNFKRRKVSLWTSTLLFVALSIPLLSNLAISKWEFPPRDKSSLPLFDAAIVLTGMVEYNKVATDQINFNSAADRITEAVSLYDAGIVRQIILTGGSGYVLNQKDRESVELREFLLSSGVPIEDILVEPESRNTHENASYTKELLIKEDLIDRNLLLITSAFHMRRSLACFAKEDIEVQPFAVDFRSSRVRLDLGWILPSHQSFATWQMLLKEVTGMIAYKLVGYT